MLVKLIHQMTLWFMYIELIQNKVHQLQGMILLSRLCFRLLLSCLLLLLCRFLLRFQFLLPLLQLIL